MMKSNRILIVFLSVVLCVSMALMPIGVLADETPASSEETTIETSETSETVKNEKPKSEEPEKTVPNESKAKVPEEKESETIEEKESKSTEEKVDKSTKDEEPEATTGKTPESTEAKASTPNEEELPETAKDKTIEGKIPGKKVKKSAKNSVSGNCGDNVTWTFNDGTLTVSGSGFIWAEWSDDDDLSSCLKDTTNVVIEDGITSISIWAFSGCAKLESITIPDSVTNIGEEAFKNCKSLKNITLPNRLDEIGRDAFYGCTSLTSITIPKSVKYVGYWAFCKCENLKTVTLTKELYDDIVMTPRLYTIATAERFDNDGLNIKFVFSTKAANPLKVKGKTAKVKYKKLRKKKQTLSVSKVIAFTKKGQGKLTYAKLSGNKKIQINKSTGKVTVKKKLKKRTYTVKVRVMAAGNEQYKPSGWKTVTFKIRVK